MNILRYNIATLQIGLPVRTEMFDGRHHLVVPVVALVEGVHVGNVGALYYPADEIAKYPECWNGVPLPVFHPEEFGKSVSANTPQLLEEKSVGHLFNVYFDPDGGKLKGELWIDIDKAEKIAPSVLHTIRTGGQLEVSTALWSDEDRISGMWHGEEFSSTVFNFRPDHLALLPGGMGACSWQDGCGVRANKENKGDGSMGVTILGTARTPSFEGTEKTSWANVTTTFAAYRDMYYQNHTRPEEVPNRVQDAPAALKKWIASKTLLGDGNADSEQDLIFFPVVNPSTGNLNEGALRAVISGQGSQADIPVQAKQSAQNKARSLLNRHFGAEMETSEVNLWEKFKSLIKAAVGNQETSHEDLRSKIGRALDALDNEAWVHYVKEVYDDFVVYEARGSNPSETGAPTSVIKLYKRGYSIDEKGNVKLKNDTKEVREERRYVPVGNVGTEDKDKKNEEVKRMDKAKLVQDLIACERTKFTDEHKDWLMTLSEDQLKVLQVEEEKKPEEKKPEKKEPEATVNKAEEKKEPEKKTTEEKIPVTVDEFIGNAPTEVQSVLKRAVDRDRKIKEEMVKALLANERNKFTEEQLKAKEIDELQNLAELARIDADFSLQVGGPVASNKDKVPAMPPSYVVKATA